MNEREKIAVELALRLARGGVKYEVKNGNLQIRPADKLTAATIARIKQYKSELIDLRLEWDAENIKEREAIQRE